MDLKGIEASIPFLNYITRKNPAQRAFLFHKKYKGISFEIKNANSLHFAIDIVQHRDIIQNANKLQIVMVYNELAI